MVVSIDGAHGEGGGQIIRTSLALSAITGNPTEIRNIRANRKNPGLQNQHLVALRAAATICGAKLHGDSLGSTKLSFEPGQVRAGDFEFPIGTAGSTSLVLQTILPILMIGTTSSNVVLEGGTHNPMAPPFDFLQHTFLPLIGKMGPQVECDVERYGFYPKGGGRVHVLIEPVSELATFDLLERGTVHDISAQILLVNLPLHIAERESRVLKDQLQELREVDIIESNRSPGAGNMVAVHVKSDALTETITTLGERGLTAEKVAESAAASTRWYLNHGAPVGEYLADQLLLPMALAGGGSFVTEELSEHTRTNMHVIKQFIDADFEIEPLEEKRFKITVK